MINRVVTKETRNALLKAIQDGIRIQDQTENGYLDITDEKALMILANGGGNFLRAKPNKVTINGLEVAAPDFPDRTIHQWTVEVRFLSPDSKVINSARVSYTNRANGLRMFNALIDPVKGW